MKKFNFLADRVRPMKPAQERTSGHRRAGIGKIVAELQLAHPNLNEDQIATRARIEWEKRNRSAKQ